MLEIMERWFNLTHSIQAVHSPTDYSQLIHKESQKLGIL